VSRCKTAVACSTRNAGSIHPHKFVTEILKLALASTTYQVSLLTSTPVLDITKNSLATPKGKITADKVVLCTNAHTAHLFPEGHPIRKLIYPVRSQMGLITPTLEFSGTKSPENTYGFDKGYFMTSTGGIVLGAGAMDYLAEGIKKAKRFILNVEDWGLIPECEECGWSLPSLVAPQAFRADNQIFAGSYPRN
jgi:glycine/D-amino acid oxidase-like deaminating enzyme